MELSAVQLLIVVAAGVISHALLAAFARRLNPLMAVIAAFFVFAPLSAAIDLPGFEAFKYARLYCSILIVLVGVFLMRAGKPRPAGLVFLLWAVYYMAAALYGPAPVPGLKMKGLYVLVVLSGLVAAYGLRGMADLRIGLRMILIGSGLFSLILLREMVTNPGAASAGRLMAFGLNPSRIGQECAPMIICASAVAFYDRSKTWRLLGYGISGVLALAIVSSGSRGGAFMSAIGIFACAFPLIKRPVLLGFTLLVVYFVGGFILDAVSPTASERLGDLSFETRRIEWAKAWTYFFESPFIGQGWVMDEGGREGGSTQNMHSVYMQVLAETGVLGMMLFGAMIGFVLWRAFTLYLFARTHHADTRYVYFTVGLMGALLAHCMAESSTIMGSNINGIMLPFTIGLVDRLREMLAVETQPALPRHRSAYAYDYTEEFGYGDEQPGLATG